LEVGFQTISEVIETYVTIKGQRCGTPVPKGTPKNKLAGQN